MSTITLALKERDDFQEENSKLLKNFILKYEKTAEATVKILEHQTLLTNKLLSEVDCLKNAMEAEVRALFMRMSKISSRW